MTEIVVTPEMRAAVYAADCQEQGHLLMFHNAMYSSGRSLQADSVGAQDHTQLAHIFCRRCGCVWLVIEHAAPSYEEALAQLDAVVSDPKFITPQRPAPPSITLPMGGPEVEHQH